MGYESSLPQSYFPVKKTDRIFIASANQVDYSDMNPTKINSVKENPKKHSEWILLVRKDGIHYGGPEYRKISNVRLFLQYDHNPNGWDVAYEALDFNGKKVLNVAGQEMKGKSLEKIIKKYM